MNWKLMILAAVMVVAVLGLFVMEFGDGNGSRWDHDFVQIASGGSYSDGVLVLHSVYVRYLLPMQVEIQCFQWSEGVDAFSGA